MNEITFPKLGLKFNLPEIAFSIFGIDVHWYAIFIMTGIVLAYVYASRKCRKFGLHMDAVFDPIFIATFGAIICARAYYVIFNFSQFKDNLWSVFEIWNGGIAIYGGIIGAFLTGFIVCKIKKIPFLPLCDMASIGFLIGQGLGRWGNFFNAEAFGSNTNLPWGMSGSAITREAIMLNYSGAGIDAYAPVHPCFLYESLWCLLGVFVLNYFVKKRRYDGQITLLYICWYGFERMIVEGLRTDSLYIGNLRVSQILALLLLLAGIAALIIIGSKIKRRNDENYLPLFVNTEASAQLIAKAEEDSKKDKEMLFFWKKKNNEPSKTDETIASDATEEQE